MPGSRRAYLYVSRDFNVPGFQQSQRASTVLADYNSLFDRSRQLQVSLNGALYLGSLLLLALAVIAAIVVGDRLVRPLGTQIGATRTTAHGALSVRLPPPPREDEFWVLPPAIPRITHKYQRDRPTDVLGNNLEA